VRAGGKRERERGETRGKLRKCGRVAADSAVGGKQEWKSRATGQTYDVGGAVVRGLSVSYVPPPQAMVQTFPILKYLKSLPCIRLSESSVDGRY
jgi:hypothetical protein